MIVTGSSSGIGEAVARRFSKEGANVVLVSRTREKLDKVAADLAAERTLVHVCDVSDEAQVQAMVAAAIARFGGLDVLVSNAGTAVMKDFADTTTEDWKTTLATDLDAVFYGAKAALPHLIASKGCIVHTASVSGLGGD